MKPLSILTTLLSLYVAAGRAEMSKGYAERLSRCIWLQEGGERAKKPYGILSVKVNSVADAKIVCLRSITNNWRRWEKAGKPGEFIQFMGSRWCPVVSDPKGHKNWVNNVRKLMKEKQK